jgi:hypothetical protein
MRSCLEGLDHNGLVGTSLPPPGGPPGSSGAGEPVPHAHRTNLMEKVSLTEVRVLGCRPVGTRCLNEGWSRTRQLRE